MSFVLATFNVKDLFEAVDPVSRAHLDAKLACLTEMLGRVDADLVGLQEVGSPRVLAELLQALTVAGKAGYLEPVIGTPDARGIRNVLLSRRPILASRIYTADQLEFPPFYVGDPSPFGARIPLRRGVAYAAIDGGAGEKLHALVMHFKSNRPVPLRSPSGAPLAATTARQRTEGDLRSLAWRAAEALFVRGIVDELMKDDHETSVAVLGDLNDAPGSLVVRIVCGDGPTKLEPAADLVPEAQRYSHLHQGTRAQIDHVLLSSRLRGRLRSARFLNDNLRDHSTIPDESPTADSDHAPLVVTLG